MCRNIAAKKKRFTDWSISGKKPIGFSLSLDAFQRLPNICTILTMLSTRMRSSLSNLFESPGWWNMLSRWLRLPPKPFG
jgi:hypothetical protein